MRKLIVTCLLCLTIGLYANGLDSFNGLSGTLNIAGGTAHIAAEKEAIKNIMKANPSVNITIAGGGSGVGIKQVTEGLIDLANAGRAPKKAEVERGNLQSFVFAIDGIGVVVNPKSAISNLTKEQLLDIFNGKITSFKSLGDSQGGKINLYIRDASSGTRAVFSKKAINNEKITVNAKVVASNAAMKTAVAKDMNGIGFISLGVADKSVKLVCIDGHCPSTDNVISGKYDISRGLYMLTSGKPKPLAKAFISYMKSDDGAKICAKHGFIPVQK